MVKNKKNGAGFIFFWTKPFGIFVADLYKLSVCLWKDWGTPPPLLPHLLIFVQISDSDSLNFMANLVVRHALYVPILFPGKVDSKWKEKSSIELKLCPKTWTFWWVWQLSKCLSDRPFNCQTKGINMGYFASNLHQFLYIFELKGLHKSFQQVCQKR